MAMRLDKVVPFGRSLDEYRHMFALSEEDLGQRIIGVGDGPASFNAEMTAMGRSVVSVDPVYAFEAAAIRSQFDAVVENIIAQVKATPDDWVWRYHRSADQLRQRRIQVFEDFIADYDAGKATERYCCGELPALGFRERAFGLALCSHLLFLYSEQLSYEFHLAALREMLRVAVEVRVFPLLTLMGQFSPHVAPLIEALRAEGFEVEVIEVDYEFQRGANTMLRVRRPA